MSSSRRVAVAATLFWLAALAGYSQTIEFESGGLKYRTLTKKGVTIMLAPLPTTVRNYSILQVAVANGAKTPCIIRPEDFSFQRGDGAILTASPARSVVGELI